MTSDSANSTAVSSDPVPSNSAPSDSTSFDSLNLSKPILKAVLEQGYSKPTPIQAKAIPAILDNCDVLAAAQTGTGKTAGFTLPILQQLSEGKAAASNQARALILTPTRELAAQVADNIATYGKYLPLYTNVVFGGVNINPQMKRLRRGTDILVATPGRLLDLYTQNAIKFNQLEILVLDEADRMLDMGFIHAIKRIIKVLPKQRQSLMFSATFSGDIRNLAKDLMNKPIEISVSPPNTTVAAIQHWVYPVDKKQKSKLLIKLVKENNWHQVLVFSRTKHGADRLSRDLAKTGITSAAIHGNKSQGARTRALKEFKGGNIQVLVATDIAARGLDIDQLPNVVNFDLPHVPEDYVHRIGRTGRAGASGTAISLVSADEFQQLTDIERLIKRIIPRHITEGFEPTHSLPESRTDKRPQKNRRPNKPKPQRRSEHRSEHRGESRSERKTEHRNEQKAENRTGNSNGNRTEKKSVKNARRKKPHSRKNDGNKATGNKRSESKPGQTKNSQSKPHRQVRRRKVRNPQG